MADDWTTKINTGVPNPARIYDYFLGGKDNFPADREVAERVAEDLLGKLPAPVDSVHRLQRVAFGVGSLAEAVCQPVHECAGLLGEPEPEQRVEGKRGVAHPRVAVVPVARAAEPLGQAGGRAATMAPVGA